MKQIILAGIGIFLSLSLFSQNKTKFVTDITFESGSEIVFPELTDQQLDDLDLLGRIWGFLKYYHPHIAQGMYNWDYELFRMLPEYLRISEPQSRDAYLTKWIRHYGKIQTNKNVTPVDSTAFMKPDMGWINADRLSPKLYKLLIKVYQNRNQGKQHYVSQNLIGAGNVRFDNENSYSDMPYPDARFRLLTVYRYWNIMQYFFPYRYLTDTPWNDVLEESIRDLINASDSMEYFYAVKKMVAKCNDSHGITYSRFINPFIDNLRPPFDVCFLSNDTLVVKSYRAADKVAPNGPHIGDIITHINHRPISQLIDSIAPYIAASTPGAKMREIAWEIVCGMEPYVDVTFCSDGKSHQATIERYSFQEMSYIDETDGICFQMLNDSIGYISMDDITTDLVKTLADSLKRTKGLILDLREYPKEVVQYELGRILSNNYTQYFKATEPSLKNPGEFVFTAPMYTSKGNNQYKGKIIILINEQTQSHAEFCAMFYKTIPNSIVIGTNSAGADGNVSRVPLPGGIYAMFSGIGIYYPNGTETQRVGIIPDIYVWPTVKGIREGRDEILEKAIELLERD